MSRDDVADSYQQMLAAIAAALDVPFPAAYGDRVAHRELLLDRVAMVRGVISDLERTPGADPSHAVETLAEMVAEMQPTYPVLARIGAS